MKSKECFQRTFSQAGAYIFTGTSAHTHTHAHKPGHVENSFRHHKSHAEEQITGWDEGKDQEQHAHQHLLSFHLLHKERDEAKVRQIERETRGCLLLEKPKVFYISCRQCQWSLPMQNLQPRCYFVARALF